MKIQHHEDYRKRRQADYPVTGDQLDAVYKMAVALQQLGIELPADTVAWMTEIEAVKNKYPKS